MLLAVIIALIILSISLLLHYCQHFKIICCKPKNQRRVSIDGTVPTNRFNCCVLVTRDEEEFDFFPAAFLYYLTFQILLCLLIIAVDIASYCISNNNQTNISEILLSYTITTYHHIHNFDDSLFTYNHKVHLSNFNELNEYQLITNITDYILCYSVMLLLLWESLFSFYKYYTTLFVVLHCKIATTKIVTMRFMIYAIIFFVCFNLQIHFYYYLWPILLILHFTFNIYCTLKFSSILITKYISFTDIDDRFENEDNTNILNSVYFMRRTSIICNIFQTIYLGLFIVSYSATTIYYLPILWSICGGVYTIMFIRNRKYILFKIFECKYNKCIKQFNRNVHHNHKNIRSTLSKPNIESNVRVKSNSVHAPITPNQMNINISTNSNEVTNSGAINTCTVSSTVSGEHYTYPMTDNLPISPPKISNFGNYKLQSIPNTPITPSLPPIKTNKALELLGIQPSKTHSISKNDKKIAIIPKPLMVQSRSDHIGNENEMNAARTRSMSISEENNYISMMKLNALKHAIKVSQSDITKQNKINNSINETKQPELPDEIDIKYTPKLPSRRLSSPSVPVDNNVDVPEDKNITINVDDIEYIGGDDSAENDEEFACVYLDGYKQENIDTIAIVLSENTTPMSPTPASPIPSSCRASTKPPIKLKHQRSNSAPGDVRKSIGNFEQVMGSLDLFAKYGFCSRNSVNSLYQLTKYQYKINKR